jgi:signal transduction histidine kinase
MKSTTVYLVQLPDSLREMAMLAAREIFPRAQLVSARTVGDATHLPAQGRQLLVLGEANEREIGLAAQAQDVGELPRWAVVHLGSTPSDLVETLPPAECTVRVLARIFRSALMHHELLRENLQLRGDLKTVARRFNHDVRTPLGCIDTVCSLLEHLPGETGQPQEETIATIRQSTAEISALLDRVSFVLKASSEPLVATPVSMGPVIQRVIAGLPPTLERRSKIRQPTRWPEVMAVDAWVDFIWANLIQNALKHGGSTGFVETGWDAKGAEIRFWVSSPGGVPAPLRPNLLRPFNILHQTPSAGLGLSLVERLVSLHGGRCGYETTADDRALFFFTLPASPGFRTVSGDSAFQRGLAENRVT